MDYQYGNKKQWRRWLWNRISERTEDRSKALVLFLAGEGAHDIEVAERNGFNRKNMIAIERDPVTRDVLRSRGVLTIDGDLETVLQTWPADRQVAVLVADMCCGLHESLLRSFFNLLMHPAFDATCMAVNLLRGRDASTNWVREARQNIEWASDSKHRGEVLFDALASAWSGQNEPTEQLVRRRLALFFDLARPAQNSYRSTAGTQVFDTVVYKSPLGGILSNELKSYRAAEWGKITPVGHPQRRKIAAVMAHHTRRAA